MYSLKEDITEYYRLIAVLGAQLNSDAAKVGKRGHEGDGNSTTATEGMTLIRLAVWVQDPMERLRQTAIMVSAAAHLKARKGSILGVRAVTSVVASCFRFCLDPTTVRFRGIFDEYQR